MTERKFTISRIDFYFSPTLTIPRWVKISRHDQLGIIREKSYTKPTAASLGRLAHYGNSQVCDSARTLTKRLYPNGWSVTCHKVL